MSTIDELITIISDRRPKKLDRKTQDKFSDLPIDLKHLILQHLPIEEIVRTSILCTQWRHVIYSHPNLIFDQNSYDHWLKNQCYTPFKSPVDEFLKSIIQILSNYTGLLERFILYVPYEEVWKNSHSLVRQIVSVVPKTITHLCVRNGAHDECRLKISFFKELTHLELDRCSIPSRLQTTLFPKLTQLDLRRVCNTHDLVHALKRIAPRLEHLRLWSCYELDHDGTTIDVPSLTELFMDKCCFYVLLSSDTSKLSSVTIGLDRHWSSLIGFHQHLHTLTRLEILDSYTFQCLNQMKLADDTSWALQKLIIHGINQSGSEGSVIGLVELLQRAKNVRELWIKDTTRRGRCQSDDSLPFRFKGVTLDRLRTLSFTIQCVSRVDVLLLKCLLGCAPALVKLNIGFGGRLCVSERQNIEKKLL
ncbi:hypothetical protein RND81_05G140900 [Saponaria officinalis]|uniref:F-box domain-containing protein n=1 Tax=Saponaria officinalis TaxID=3572 RepID=A0AAW1KXH3_SAPOF